MANKGYIRLHRQLQDCWIWFDDTKFSKGQAWVDLILLANHKDKKMSFNGDIKIIERGQYLTSLRKLSERWGWHRNTVKTFLELLKKDQMIDIECTTKYTLVTIVNYDIYQFREDECVPQDVPPTVPPSVPQGVPPTSTNNNDINDKNDKKNIYMHKFEETWKLYPKHEDKAQAYDNYKARINDGWSEEELLIATRNYAEFCKKENREKKYIKSGKTFYGVHTPFVDFLPKKESDSADYQDGYFVFPIDEYYEENPPYFGFPTEWFKDGKLVKDLIKPIRQLPKEGSGMNKPLDYSVGALIKKYEERRRWYERENNGS